MSYKALYRTYRPTTFDEVAGQNHIIRTLKNALKENKIAHAYLFCGPRGTGKTTMARLFAKALNCEEGFAHQCNKCPNCIAINEGKHPDVIEIDAASNRGIDDIRDLISKVKYSPIMGEYKVYIIDEVHMMTTEAFNALLKTLEEPPEKVVFILATTEPYKLMPTILSRCQRYDFTKVSDGDIYNRLMDILQEEKVEADEEALSLIVSLADGGVRDSLSMLDQAIAYCDNKITLKDIEELYGLSSNEEKIKLLNYINSGDILNVNKCLNNFFDRGVDIKRLTSDLLEILKDLLIYQTTKDASLLKILHLEELESINLDNKKINKMIDILLNALAQYRLVNNVKSLFEITMLKMSSLAIENEEEKENIKIVEKVVIKEVPSNNDSKKEEVIEDKKVVAEPKVESSQNETPKPTTNYTSSPTLELRKEELKKEIDAFPLTYSNVSFTNIEPLMDEGDKISFEMEDIVNIMVQATKEAKNVINNNWSLLDRLITNNRVGKYAAALKLAVPRIVCKDAIVLESQFKKIVNQINLKQNQLGFNKIFEVLCGENCIIIALTQQDYVDAVKKFTNLQQANKLPKKGPINIDVKINHQVEKSKTQTETLVEELFNEGE